MKYIAYILMGLILIGMQVAIQPNTKQPKTALVKQLEVMVKQCKDLEECTATHNVLNRELNRSL